MSSTPHRISRDHANLVAKERGMRADTIGLAVAIAVCTTTVSAIVTKAADGRYWAVVILIASAMVRCAMYTSGSISSPALTFGNGAAAGGRATTIAVDGPISTATLPTAVTFSAAANIQAPFVRRRHQSLL